MKIEVRSKIHPSENPKKVLEAVSNLFPEIEPEIKEDYVVGESTKLESLEKFKNRLGLQSIRDSARREMKKGKNEDSIEVSLNKQAAMVDKISFSGEDTPLGPIKLSVKTGKIDELINNLAPSKEQRG